MDRDLSAVVTGHASNTVEQFLLSLTFEGRNPDTDKPIIKVFLNPLVNWIWIGVAIMIFGTAIALVPALKPGASSSTTALSSKVGRTSEEAQEVAHA